MCVWGGGGLGFNLFVAVVVFACLFVYCFLLLLLVVFFFFGGGGDDGCPCFVMMYLVSVIDLKSP